MVEPQALVRSPNQIHVPIPYENPKLNWDKYIVGVRRWAKMFRIGLGRDYGFRVEIIEIPETIMWHTFDESGGFLIDSRLGPVSGRVGVVNKKAEKNGVRTFTLTPGIPISTSMSQGAR